MVYNMYSDTDATIYGRVGLKTFAIPYRNRIYTGILFLYNEDDRSGRSIYRSYGVMVEM